MNMIKKAIYGYIFVMCQVTRLCINTPITVTYLSNFQDYTSHMIGHQVNNILRPSIRTNSRTERINLSLYHQYCPANILHLS